MTAEAAHPGSALDQPDKAVIVLSVPPRRGMWRPIEMKGLIDMRLGNYLMAAAAATMAVAPAVAAPTPLTTPVSKSVRAGTTTADENDLRGGGIYVALIAAAAVIAGIIIVANDDDDDNDSPNSP